MALTSTLKITRTRKAPSSSAVAPASEPSPNTVDPGRPSPKGKLGAVADLLRRPQGASIAEMAEATGWQAHSIRGALAGALRRKHGLAISSEMAEGGRVYRIAADPA